MAALEALSSLFISSSQKSPLFKPLNTPPSSSRLALFISTPTPSPLSLKFPISPLTHVPRKYQLYCSAVEEITVQEETTIPDAAEATTKPAEAAEAEAEAVEASENPRARRKLFVTNLPWAFTVEDIKMLFGECGTVTDVEVIKSSDGKHRGYVFVTMATGKEAEAAIEKFNSYDVSGRIIRIEYSKRLKRPPPPPPPTAPRETRYKLYVSNLAWKVRSTHLRDLFATVSNPVSVKVVFDRPSGKSRGYGFVSYTTKEEAEAALSALNGKELLERPIILKLNEIDIEKSGDEVGSTTSEEELAVVS